MGVIGQIVGECAASLIKTKPKIRFILEKLFADKTRERVTEFYCLTEAVGFLPSGSKPWSNSKIPRYEQIFWVNPHEFLVLTDLELKQQDLEKTKEKSDE